MTARTRRVGGECESTRRRPATESQGRDTEAAKYSTTRGSNSASRDDRPRMGRDVASAETWLPATAQERHSTQVQWVSATGEAKESSARRCAPPPSEHPRKRQNATRTWAAGFPRKCRRPQQPKRSTKAPETGHEHDAHPGVVRIEGGRRFPSATGTGLNKGAGTPASTRTQWAQRRGFATVRWAWEPDIS